MCKDFNMAEALANKIEYCDLIKDVNYTMDDFYDEMGLFPEHRTNYGTVCLMKQAQDILEARREC